MYLIVFAGPNGSGKTTMIAEYLEKQPDLEYICPDIYAENHKEIEQIETRYKVAMREAEAARFSKVENKEPFALETVFSTRDKLDFIDYAREHGYYVHVVFFTTIDPVINIQRVKKRKSEGGHDVPAEKIIERYHRSMALLPDILSLADEVQVYDNSRDDGSPLQILYKIEGEYIFLSRGRRPREYDIIKTDLVNRGYQVCDLTENETSDFFK